MRLFYIFLFSFLSNFLLAQSETQTAIDSNKVEVLGIEFNEIANETERLNGRFSEIGKILLKNDRLPKIDSALVGITLKVEEQRDLTLIDSVDNSYREIETKLRKWLLLKKEIDGYKGIVRNRLDELQEISKELFDYLEVWDLTRKEAIKREVSTDVIASIDSIAFTLQSIIDENNIRVDSVFIIQKNITNIILIIDDMVSELKLREQQLKRGYFVIDSPPIWNAKDSLYYSQQALQSDTISMARLYINDIKEGLNSDKEIFIEYLKSNIPSLLFQLITFILLFIGIIILRKKELGRQLNIDKKKDHQFIIVLQHPIISVLTLGTLITLFYYVNRPFVFGELAAIILIICSIILLPKLTNKSLRPLLILSFLAYILYLFLNYLPQKDFIIRLVLYVNLVLMLVVLLRIKYSLSFKDLFKDKWMRFLRVILLFYLMLIVIGLIANTIGSVNLTKAISSGLLQSTVLVFIVALFIKILVNISLMILKSRQGASSIVTISALIEMINVRVRPLLELFGLILWLIFTLRGFKVFDDIVDLITSLFSAEWNLGSIKISIGDILSFILILLITFLISGVISKVLKDEWVIKAMPKGTSSGLSMVARIIVVIVGMYLAVTSAGIDIGKLGFMVGALGVGIGFGLQSVVLNFIAGLILAFERPIIVGDVIMADMEMGVVSDIGVRASKIKLYDGSEVIIPNGDLISKKVTNYTMSDYKRRSKIVVRTSVHADPNEVIELLTNSATKHEKTLDDPMPKTYFKGYGDSSLDFNLLYWVQFDDKFSTDSEIALDVYNLLKEKGIHLPIPKVSIEKSDEE